MRAVAVIALALLSGCGELPTCAPGMSHVEMVEGWRKSPESPGSSVIYEYGLHPVWVCDQYEEGEDV